MSEVIWKRTSAHGSADRYGPIHDTIFYYGKGGKRTWNKPITEYDDSYIRRFYRKVDEDGRRYQLIDCSAPGDRKGTKAHYEWRGRFPPPGRHWAVVKEEMERLEAKGLIVYSSKGTPRKKQYLDEMHGQPVQDIWIDIKTISSHSNERVNYTTQKPEALLERIIRASSNEGDLVLDCFCGSGTTAAVAEKLNRRWIGCDLGRFAIHTTRKRLLGIENVKPFAVQNLGKYERQAWQAAEFGGAERAAEVTAQYRRFILELYHARPITGYNWLHGLKGGRMVHVGAVDAPISPGDVQQIALEFRKATGTGKDAPSVSAVDVLGWDFAFELNEVARQQAAQANIQMRFLRIPREVLEKKAVEQGDIRFFELAALFVEVAQEKRKVSLKLTDFVIPPDDVPTDVQAAITHWAQWIDYWAVDWDNKGDTFHNMWQTYRTRKEKSLKLWAGHKYETAGEYTIMVKVIDILGNDTTKTLKVKIG